MLQSTFYRIEFLQHQLALYTSVILLEVCNDKNPAAIDSFLVVLLLIKKRTINAIKLKVRQRNSSRKIIIASLRPHREKKMLKKF